MKKLFKIKKIKKHFVLYNENNCQCELILK